MWVTTEISQDPCLVENIRAELSKTEILSSLRSFEVKTLLSLPRLQAVYAETLRLRVHVIVPRETNTENLQINKWVFPNKSTIVVSSQPAHMDSTVWNLGPNKSHPTNTFWAERFLAYEYSPASGPISKPSVVVTTDLGENAPEDSGSDSKAPKFVLSSTAGHWFPYGGGARICPGRHFAKRAIMTATAVMISMFDIEIMATSEAMKMDKSGYGLGMQRPAGNIRYRMRRAKSEQSI